MAITLTQLPSNFAPVYNDMVIVASSTNTAQTSFSYIFEVYDAANTTLLSTQRIAPEYQYGYGVLNAARILESYIATDFFDNLTGDIKLNTNSYEGYTIRVGEEYDVSGTLTQFLDLANTSADYFNGSLLNKDWLNFSITNYELNGTTKKFLTNTPAIQSTSITDKGYMSYYNVTVGNKAVYKTYDVAGVIIGTYEIDLAAITETIAQIPSAPDSINNVTLTSGVQPVVSSSVNSYTIEMQNAGSTQISEIKTFNVSTCNRGRLHFLNDLGGFDAFNFSAANKTNWQFQKEHYKSQPNRLTAAGAFEYSTTDREWIQYYTNQKESVKLVRDWITNDDAIWLRQLLSSPEIYLELDGEIRSLKGIKASSYDVKDTDYDELFNLEIEIEFSIDNYRQRY
jgi:hypothetical protein